MWGMVQPCHFNGYTGFRHSRDLSFLSDFAQAIGSGWTRFSNSRKYVNFKHASLFVLHSWSSKMVPFFPNFFIFHVGIE